MRVFQQIQSEEQKARYVYTVSNFIRQIRKYIMQIFKQNILETTN